MTLEQSKEHQEFWKRPEIPLEQRLKEDDNKEVRICWDVDCFQATLFELGYDRQRIPLCNATGQTISHALENLAIVANKSKRVV